MDKAKKTRMLMESFNKFLKESETTPEIVDTPKPKDYDWKEYETSIDVELDGNYIDYAEVLVYYTYEIYDADRSVGIMYGGMNYGIEEVWMKLENGKWRNITDSIDKNTLDYLNNIAKEEIDAEREPDPDMYRD